MSDDTNVQKQAEHNLDGMDNTPPQHGHQSAHTDAPSHASASPDQAHSGPINHADSAQSIGQNTHSSHSQHQSPVQNHQSGHANEAHHQNHTPVAQSPDHHSTNQPPASPQHGAGYQHHESAPDSLAAHQTTPSSSHDHQPTQTVPLMGQVATPATAGAGVGFGAAPDHGIATVSPTPSVPSPAVNTMPNTYTGAKKSHLKLIMIILGVLVVGGVATAYGVYTSFVTDPQQALGAYLYRLSHSKTVVYDAKMETGEMKIAANGSYDITDTKKPKVDLTASITSDNKTYGGQLKLIDLVAYFKLDQNTANQLQMPSLSDWYKYDLNDLSKNSEPASDAKDCSTDPKVQGQILGQDVLLNIPVKGAKRVGLYETVNSIKTSHFTGEVDFAKLGTLVDKLNKDLPEKCKLSYKASDYSKSKVTYDIWSGLNFDRLILHTSSTDDPNNKADITLETKDYDKEVKIEAPTDAKDMSNLFSDMQSASIDKSLSSIGDIAPTDISKLFNTLTKPSDTLNTLQSRFKSASSALTKSTAVNVAKTKISVPIEDSTPVAMRNQQRQTDVNAIAGAIYQYRIDNAGNLPAGVTTTPTGLCKTDAHCDVLINLTALTQDSKYLAKLPVDPSATGQYSTGYEVSIDGLNHIVVSAPLAENGVPISIIR